MNGKMNYVHAVYLLGQYIDRVSPEVARLDEQLEEIYNMTGLVDKILEDRMFAKKAEALERLLIELESGVKYMPAREVQ